MTEVEVEKREREREGREGKRECAPSLTVSGSGECAARPSLGLTNSRANTHLTVTLKSKAAAPSIIASRGEEKASD